MGKDAILVVDHTIAFTDMLSDAFRLKNIAVKPARDFNEASSLYEQNEIAVLLIDMSRNYGDAIKFCSYVHSRDASLAQIALVSSCGEPNCNACYDAGIKKCFRKPLKIEKIYDIVEATLDKLSTPPTETAGNDQPGVTP